MFAVFLHVCILRFAWTHACVLVWMHPCMYACRHTRIHVYVYSFVHVCVRTRVRETRASVHTAFCSVHILTAMIPLSSLSCELHASISKNLDLDSSPPHPPVMYVCVLKYGRWDQQTMHHNSQKKIVLQQANDQGNTGLCSIHRDWCPIYSRPWTKHIRIRTKLFNLLWVIQIPRPPQNERRCKEWAQSCPWNPYKWNCHKNTL